MFGANNYLPIFSLGPIRGGRPVSMDPGKSNPAVEVSERRKNIFTEEMADEEILLCEEKEEQEEAGTEAERCHGCQKTPPSHVLTPP